MKPMAKQGEEYFTSLVDAIVVVDNRIYSFSAGVPEVVESIHLERIKTSLKEGDVVAEDAADESSNSDVARRQYRRKSSGEA